MRHTLLLTACVVITTVVSSLSPPVTAQTAVRCDNDGQTVYSDKPCPPGNAAKAVVPTQDTAEQKAAGQAASAQIRKDNEAVDKRLDDRLKRETAGTSTVAVKAKPDKATAAKPKRSKSAKTKVSKAKVKKSAKSGKPKVKQDTTALRQKP